ncbi:MAG: hypothetical protein OXU66_08105 [Gammaproteobacteria bacterium]|nr:hypothetical protein [Gammaproteobacteria bacterium]MDD9895228.1 hypothetical protein [Gammaproteobacteria bacterium]MDD9958890.1 hypothetical protein [Gammaproteobacteria bacterium]
MINSRLAKTLCIVWVALFTLSGIAEVNSIHIESRLDPNAIIITQVDIIFVYSQEIVDRFPATKTEWYSNQRQFIADADDGIDLRSVFIPQGFNSETASLPQRRNQALKVFIFAEHDASTAAPVDVTDFEDVLVAIDEFGIVVTRRT